ncbi:hypothetical protein HPB51_005061 [Rhipicephalus microplus]|uniref:Maltase n=1 Tax=Rhipicephalus microplus TaxID=6941 RepID=A0A9J6EXZ4_RHIMP|nr:hypothetical protein HPB51_005061 [Rhipicephalus microplus]
MGMWCLEKVFDDFENFVLNYGRAESRSYTKFGREEDEEEGSSSSAEDGTSAESALAGGGVTLKPQQHRKRCCDDDFSSLSTRLRCLLAAVIVLLVLTAVFVPLYYFVFREHLGPLWRTLFGRRVADVSGGAETTVGGTTLDETLAPFPATPEWKPQCPEAPVLERNRFDCFPENPDVDLSTCEDRGCCWAVTNVRNDKDGPAAREHFRDHVPKCILPLNSGYRIAGPEESLFAGYEVPLLRIPSPSRYGDDITHLKVRVHMQTPYRLRVKIYDSSEQRYEVPDPVIPVEMDLGSPLVHEGDVQMYATSYSLGSDPFSFQVRRTKTGTVIFDTGVGALVFSHQFLQISARLPSSLVYGLGEHVHDHFKHDMNWRTWAIFNRDAFPEDYSNLYGSHPMYMCIEKDNSAHAVLLLNSNAMEIQLQPTPAVTLRTTGGVLDFYFFMGPSPEEVVRQYTEAVGRPMMPPYWALGFHLGRWGYRTTDYVRDTQKKMRDMNMPQDVAHVDKDILYKQRLFTLDQNNFAKLPDLVKDLHGRGQRFTVVMEPGVAAPRGEPGPYVPLESGERLGVFVNDTWGTQPIQGLTGNEPSNYANGSVNGCLQDNLNQPPYKPRASVKREPTCSHSYEKHNYQIAKRLSTSPHYRKQQLLSHSRFALLSNNSPTCTTKKPQVQTAVEILPRKCSRQSVFINVYCAHLERAGDFNLLFQKTTWLSRGAQLLILGDFNARHHDWGYLQANKRGKKLWQLRQDLRLTLLNDLQQSPTRIGNSVCRDTSPDLAYCKNIAQARWENTCQLAGSDHYMISIQVQTSTANRVHKALARITEWPKFRDVRESEAPERITNLKE